MAAAKVVVDVDHPPVISQSQERAILKAFAEHEEFRTLYPPRRDHLAVEHRPGVCCTHQWVPVAPTDENLKHLRERFEETELGTAQQFCKRCGAVGLFDQDLRAGDAYPKLWAYDATARFFGKPAQGQPSHDRSQKRGRR